MSVSSGAQDLPAAGSDALARENEELRAKLRELTSQAAYNEAILKRTQERELALLRADSLAQLLRAMVDGLRDSYGLDAVSVALLDPQRTNSGQTYAIAFRDYTSQLGGIIGPVIPVAWSPRKYCLRTSSAVGISSTLERS